MANRYRWFDALLALKPLNSAQAKVIDDFLEDMRTNVVLRIEDEIFQLEKRWAEAVRRY
ncbi:hypothetical protein [Paraburkholderia bannensis]|uniref:hypothetical protein n=1 Tax=Paraburkholderia bannensis TaxID=765414 RepID=UPI002ABE94BB|nr:hypothetical protein [Paraburkholderia bannensis]